MTHVLGEINIKEAKQMAKTNYNKMSDKTKEDVKKEVEPIVEEVVTETEPVVEKKPEKKVKKGVVVDCLKLNVRTNPHPNAAIELTIDKGTEVEITGENGDFYSVRKGTVTEGFNGWCMKKYISVK
jgi:hypothetical protein